MEADLIFFQQETQGCQSTPTLEGKGYVPPLKNLVLKLSLESSHYTPNLVQGITTLHLVGMPSSLAVCLRA